MTVRIPGVIALITFAALVPVHAQSPTPEERVRFEAIYVKVELYHNGRTVPTAEMHVTMNNCRSKVSFDKQTFTDQGLSNQLAQTNSRDLTPIAVVSTCFMNPRAGECKFDPITRKLIGCWDKK